MSTRIVLRAYHIHILTSYAVRTPCAGHSSWAFPLVRYWLCVCKHWKFRTLWAWFLIKSSTTYSIFNLGRWTLNTSGWIFNSFGARWMYLLTNANKWCLLCSTPRCDVWHDVRAYLTLFRSTHLEKRRRVQDARLNKMSNSWLQSEEWRQKRKR